MQEMLRSSAKSGVGAHTHVHKHPLCAEGRFRPVLFYVGSALPHHGGCARTMLRKLSRAPSLYSCLYPATSLSPLCADCRSRSLACSRTLLRLPLPSSLQAV